MLLGAVYLFFVVETFGIVGEVSFGLFDFANTPSGPAVWTQSRKALWVTNLSILNYYIFCKN